MNSFHILSIYHEFIQFERKKKEFSFHYGFISKSNILKEITLNNSKNENKELGLELGFILKFFGFCVWVLGVGMKPKAQT